MTSLADCFPAARQCQATRAQLRAAGLSSGAVQRALASGELLRLRRGVYALAPLPVRGRHLLRDGVPDVGYLAAARAAVTGLGRAVVARRTAAVLYGMDMLVEPDLVELRVPHGRVLQEPGIEALPSRQTRHVDCSVAGYEALPMTTPVDTVLDCATSRPMREAVVLADSALRRGLVTVEELVAEVGRRRGHRDGARWRRLLHLVDDRSGSVLESVLRYLLVLHGYRPESQYVVRRGTLLVGRFDFCLEQARVIVECDGRRWHDPEDVRQKDRQKANALTRQGWRLLRFSWDEVLHSPAYVLACLADCVALAG